MRDAFHQVAVTDDGIGVMADNFVVGPVEGFCQEGLGNGHTNPIGKALP